MNYRNPGRPLTRAALQMHLACRISFQLGLHNNLHLSFLTHVFFRNRLPRFLSTNLLADSTEEDVPTVSDSLHIGHALLTACVAYSEQSE